MNAPHAATCPTCGGSGERVRAWDMSLLGGKRGQRVLRCLACRGTGQVDPMRVCPACGKWVDQCLCLKSKIIKLEAEMATQPYYDKTNARWKAVIRRDNQSYFLLSSTEREWAEAILRESEATPTEGLPALKAKYQTFMARSKTPNGNGHAAPEPAETPNIGLTREAFAATIAELDQESSEPDKAVGEADVPDLDAADVLHQMLVAARAADRRFQAIREQYCAAERDAIEAWNEYARELAASGQSDAFTRSYLGFLREEITRS